jgi:hypothetical protein
MTVHILFGASTAGCMKWMLKENPRKPKNQVIGFTDHFAIGPILSLDSEEGLKKRIQWFQEHMPKNEFDSFYEDEYEKLFRHTLQQIEEIPEDALITVWAAENAAEQTGLRFVLKLLEERKNEILVVNTNESYNKYCKEPDIYHVSMQTGEISPEQMKVILEKTRDDERLSITLREQLVEEWHELSRRNEVLRVWEDAQIRSVQENYLDSFMIEIAAELHGKRGKREFVKSARIVGEVLGRHEQYVGDEFIEYRLLHLIEKGVFEFEGTLNGMRNYSVRLAEK